MSAILNKKSMVFILDSLSLGSFFFFTEVIFCVLAKNVYFYLFFDSTRTL